jgi:hypothetical protein
MIHRVSANACRGFTLVPMVKPASSECDATTEPRQCSMADETQLQLRSLVSGSAQLVPSLAEVRNHEIN